VRAIVVTQSGGPEVLVERDRPRPEPGPGQILVRVRASALNRADLLQRRGAYPAPAGIVADVPGLEYAGEVERRGDGADLWPEGSRVMGVVGGGGHAEFVVVHEREAIRVPGRLSFEEAAAIPEVFLTAWDAMFRQLDLRLGERLLVHAVASGVGTAALQLARAAGIETIGTSRSAEKLARARELGLGAGIDASDGDWEPRVMNATGGAGVDAVLELVGGDYLPRSLRLLAPRGRLVLVGTMAGSRAEIDLGLVLRRRLRIVGTALRSRPLEEKIALARDFSALVLPLLDDGRLRPIVDRVLSFADIVDAHRSLERDETFGKIVLRWD
jgi:NADPH:quinone reductase